VTNCATSEPEDVNIAVSVKKELPAGTEGPCSNALCVTVEATQVPCPETSKMVDPCAPATPEPSPAPQVQSENPEVCIPSPEVQVPNKSFLDSICKCRSCVEGRGQEEVVPQTFKPSCGRCGENKGENDNCPLCRFVSSMRNTSCPTKETEVVADEGEDCDCPSCAETDPCNSDVFDLKTDGKPIYEGGMCLQRAQFFMWKATNGTPTFRDLAYEGDVYKGFGVPGEGGEDGEMEMECTCEEHMKMVEAKKYHGGMELSNAQAFLWARTEPK